MTAENMEREFNSLADQAVSEVQRKADQAQPQPGQGVNGVVVTADSPAKTLTIENGIITGIA